jgi:Spy/CpxP family protein refolding chaperone
MCVMALVATASVAHAQGRPGGGGGRGGFGGFGGGGGIGMLRMEEVQKELKLTDDQKKDVTALQEKVREDMPRFERGGQDLTQEERQKRGEEFAKKAQEVNAKAEGDLAKILKPEQTARYEQLKLQREGANALAQKATADKLSLTEDQRKKIDSLITASRESARQGAGGFRDLTDEQRREAFTKMRESREKLQSDLVAVLTPDQKASWDKMLGEKFEFPAFGGGGGRGGRGGNGGAGGGGNRQRPAGNN